MTYIFWIAWWNLHEILKEKLIKNCMLLFLHYISAIWKHKISLLVGQWVRNQSRRPRTSQAVVLKLIFWNKQIERKMLKQTHSHVVPILVKVDGTSFQVFWISKLWKEKTKNQLIITTKFKYDSIAKFVLVQKWQLFCHQLLPWQRYLMIVQAYFWASNAYILKTNLVTPNFFHISFFVIWKWNYMII